MLPKFYIYLTDSGDTDAGGGGSLHKLYSLQVYDLIQPPRQLLQLAGRPSSKYTAESPNGKHTADSNRLVSNRNSVISRHFANCR